MSVLDGPGEGTWSVFAVKVVAERDEARAETARLRRLLNMAEDELIAADDHGRREAKRADTVEAEVEALKAERDETLARCETLRELADAAAYEQGLAQRRMMDAQRERDEARDREAEWAQNSIEWQRNCEEARAELAALRKRVVEALPYPTDDDSDESRTAEEAIEIAVAERDSAYRSRDLAIKMWDEARAEVEHAYREGGALYEAKIAEREAFRCGAEAMREACARWMSEREGISQWVYDDALSALPIPEEP